MAKTKIETPSSLSELPLSVVRTMITLVASGFGVVVALAWNEFIKTLVSEYIDPLLGKGGSLLSLFIYALTMTLFAVIVTMQLTKIEQKLVELDKTVKEKSKEIIKKNKEESK